MARRSPTRLTKGQQPPMVQVDYPVEGIPRGSSVMDLIVQAQGGIWNMDTRTLENAENELEAAAEVAVKRSHKKKADEAHAAAQGPAEKPERPAPGTGKSYEKDPGKFQYERGYSHGNGGKDADPEQAENARYQKGYAGGQAKRAKRLAEAETVSE